MTSRQTQRCGAQERRGAAFSALWAACLLGLLGCDEGGTVSVMGALSLAEANADFGEVPVLSLRTLDVKLCNAGRGELALFDFGLTPEVPGLVIAEAPDSIASGACAALRLQWQPASRGEMTSALTFSTDGGGAQDGTASVPIVGTSLTEARASLPAGVEFGNLCEGASALALVEVASSGNAALEITEARLEFEGEGSDGWASLAGSAALPLVIQPGEKSALALRASADFGTSALAKAHLSLATNAPDAARVRLPVTASLLPAPKAEIAPLLPVAVGGILELDGSTSRDASGAGGSDALGFEWTLQSSPLDSASSIESALSPLASLTVDVPGQYEIALRVTDANGCTSQKASASAIAQTSEGLRFELFWDSLDADLDLHLVPAGTAYFSDGDCHYSESSMAPDWGVLGDSSDDPALIRDALLGYGPEVISFPSPSEGRYRAMVHYYSSHHSLFPAVKATLRIYRFGVLAFEETHEMARSDERWEAAEASWPGGEVRSLAADDAEGGTK